MSYVTVYEYRVKRRRTGRVETRGVAYTTKSLTPHHAFLRATFPGAQTWENPSEVLTDLLPGMNLMSRPIVLGGKLIGGAA